MTITDCNCSAVDISRVPDRRAFDFVIVDKFSDPGCGKACVLPNGRVEVLKAVWERLNNVERDALLAHECAHKYCNVRCEKCSDKVAGAIMRKWGYTRPAVASAFNWIQFRTGAGRRAEAGYGLQSADRAPTPAQVRTAQTTEEARRQAEIARKAAALALARQTQAARDAAESGKPKGETKAPSVPSIGGGGPPVDGAPPDLSKVKPKRKFPWLILAAVVVVGGGAAYAWSHR